MALITMFTDAGFSPHHNIGVWAAWAKCNGITFRHEGKIKSKVIQAGEAELKAIANGLYLTTNSFRDELTSSNKSNKIIIQTDSQEAIEGILKGKHNRKVDTEIIQYIHELLTKHKLIYDLRHVKGHRGTETPRNAVNTWCDQTCTKLLTKFTSELEPPNNIIELNKRRN